MRLAIGYSTKDQVELTKQTFGRLLRTIEAVRGDTDIFWCDGSRTEKGQRFFEQYHFGGPLGLGQRVFGGADAQFEIGMREIFRRFLRLAVE